MTRKTAQVLGEVWIPVDGAVSERGRQTIEQGGFDPFTPDDWAELNTLGQRLKLAADFGGVYQLYEIR